MHAKSSLSHPPKHLPRTRTQSSPSLAIITSPGDSSSAWKSQLPNGSFPLLPRRALSITIYRRSVDRSLHRPLYNIHCKPKSVSPPSTFCSNLHICFNMEDTLASLWNSLSLTDSETTTIIIDQTKLSTPANAIVGHLAMKRFVSLFEIEKGNRSFWEVKGAMETTRLGDNIFMFVFDDKLTCDRIVDDQPWNYRGSLLMVDHVNGE